MEKDYEIFDHTADVGIIVRGRTLEEMFEKAAYAMFDIMIYAEKIEPIRKVKVSISASTLEDLLVDWLSELLYVFSTELFVMGKFNVNIQKDKEFSLKAICWGEPYNREKHGIKTEIKAVTYHQLKIDEKEGYITLLFDI
ncbi:MAG: archease [Thermoplasmata archaeon]|nr:archease [Thermoplasmata archaeon]